MTDSNRQDSSRGEIRAYIRAHHPDVGGDPAEFAAGLAQLRNRLATDAAPAVTVTGGGLQPRGAVARVLAWRQRRNRPPRVR